MLPAVLPMHPTALSILDYRVARLSSARALAADSGEARNALNILGTLHFSNFDEFPIQKNRYRFLFLQSLHPKLHHDLRSEESLIGRFLGGSLSLGECPHWGRGLSGCC